MNRSELIEGLGHVSCEYIAEAEDYRRAKRSSSAVRWGALAACAALVALGAFVALRPAEVEPPEPVPELVPEPAPEPAPEPVPEPAPEPAPGPDEPSLPEGMDRDTYYAAHFPEGEAIEDVEYVEKQKITNLEETAAVAEVGEHLPETLPNGYAFSEAYLTTTVMKDGTEYYKMDASYVKPEGSIAVEGIWIELISYTVTNGTRNVGGNDIWDYDELTADGLRERYGELIPFFYVNCGDFSVGFMNAMGVEDAEWVMEVLGEME